MLFLYIFVYNKKVAQQKRAAGLIYNICLALYFFLADIYDLYFYNKHAAPSAPPQICYEI